MDSLTTLEIATEQVIIGVGPAFLVAATDHALVLYAAGQTLDAWIQTGRHRPLAPETTLVEAVLEGLEWLEELINSQARALEIAEALFANPERLAMAGPGELSP